MFRKKSGHGNHSIGPVRMALLALSFYSTQAFALSTPPAPGIRPVTGMTGTSLTLNWVYPYPLAGVTGFQVAIATGSSAPACNSPESMYVPINLVGPKSLQAYTESGLSFLTEYAASVCAVNAEGMSTPVSITATTSPPAAANGVYNVKDFGAVGDGIATQDDTVAIQTALCTAASLSTVAGGCGSALPGNVRGTASVVMFPGPGNYMISSTIQWPAGIGLLGEGQGAKSQGVPSGGQPVKISWIGTSGDMFDTIPTGQTISETWMRGLELASPAGSTPPNNSVVFNDRVGPGVVMDNVWIEGPENEYCVKFMKGGVGVTLNNYRMDHALIAGIYWKVTGFDTASFLNGEGDNARTTTATGGGAFVLDATGLSPTAGGGLQASFENIKQEVNTGLVPGQGIFNLLGDSNWPGKTVFSLNINNVYVTVGNWNSSGIVFQDLTGTTFNPATAPPNRTSTLGNYVRLMLTNTWLGSIQGIPNFQGHTASSETHIVSAYVSPPHVAGSQQYENTYAGEFVGDITATGNVGIGTPTMTTPETNFLNVNYTPAGETPYKLSVLGTAGETIAYFSDGTQSCSITPSVAGSVSCSSDERLKKDIRPFSDAAALDKILQLKTVTYAWKNVDNGRHTGYIAQEVEKIAPEFVVTGKDGFKQVSYSGFIPWITGAIKEVVVKVTGQEDRIAALEGSKSRAPASVGNSNEEIVALKAQADRLEKDIADKDLKIAAMRSWACSQTPSPSFCK